MVSCYLNMVLLPNQFNRGHRAYTQAVAAVQAVIVLDLFRHRTGDACLRTNRKAGSAADTFFRINPVAGFLYWFTAVGKLLTEDRSLRQIKQLAGCFVNLKHFERLS